jgi:S1-C subfamily serine protease
LSGIYIAGVIDGGGADDAGIEAGDIILSINDKSVNSLSELTGIIGQYRPGDEVILKVKNKDGDEDLVKVILKDKNNSTNMSKSPESFFNEDLNAWLQPAPVDDLQKLNLKNGLKITDLKDGILKRGGLSKGFIIYDVNGVKVNSENSLDNALHKNHRNIVNLKGVYPDGVKISFEFIL